LLRSTFQIFLPQKMISSWGNRYVNQLDYIHKVNIQQYPTPVTFKMCGETFYHVFCIY
jgi:hypothetical protein